MALVCVALWKKKRNFNLIISISGWPYHKVLRVLEGIEPDIFRQYPPRQPGRPATFRVALSKEELDWAIERVQRRELSIYAIAARLGIWHKRLEYILWKAGAWKPGRSRFRKGLKREAPDNWTKAWKREYELVEMQKEGRHFEVVVDDLFPERGIEDEFEIERMIAEEFGL